MMMNSRVAVAAGAAACTALGLAQYAQLQRAPTQAFGATPAGPKGANLALATKGAAKLEQRSMAGLLTHQGVLSDPAGPPGSPSRAPSGPLQIGKAP